MAISSAPGAELLHGVPLKYLSLATLVVQNSALVLIMRYSRTNSTTKYNTSTAVVCAESLKFAISLVIHIRQSPVAVTGASLWADMFGAESQWLMMLVPAVLYFIQNNLQYVAVTCLDAATFQVTYQMKVTFWSLRATITIPYDVMQLDPMKYVFHNQVQTFLQLDNYDSVLLRDFAWQSFVETAVDIACFAHDWDCGGADGRQAFVEHQLGRLHPLNGANCRRSRLLPLWSSWGVV